MWVNTMMQLVQLMQREKRERESEGKSKMLHLDSNMRVNTLYAFYYIQIAWNQFTLLHEPGDFHFIRNDTTVTEESVVSLTAKYLTKA